MSVTSNANPFSSGKPVSMTATLTFSAFHRSAPMTSEYTTPKPPPEKKLANKNSVLPSPFRSWAVKNTSGDSDGDGPEHSTCSVHGPDSGLDLGCSSHKKSPPSLPNSGFVARAVTMSCDNHATRDAEYGTPGKGEQDTHARTHPHPA